MQPISRGELFRLIHKRPALSEELGIALGFGFQKREQVLDVSLDQASDSHLPESTDFEVEPDPEKNTDTHQWPVWCLAEERPLEPNAALSGDQGVPHPLVCNAREPESGPLFSRAYIQNL